MEPLDRDWVRGVASCDRLGEAGGPLYVAVRLSLSCPPWKVLRLAVPRGNRSRSGGVAPLLTLWVEAPPTERWVAVVNELRAEGGGELDVWVSEGGHTDQQVNSTCSLCRCGLLMCDLLSSSRCTRTYSSSSCWMTMSITQRQNVICCKKPHPLLYAVSCLPDRYSQGVWPMPSCAQGCRSCWGCWRCRAADCRPRLDWTSCSDLHPHALTPLLQQPGSFWEEEPWRKQDTLRGRGES